MTVSSTTTAQQSRWVLRDIPSTQWRILSSALVAIVAVGYYTAARVGSQFFADDFLYLQLARQGRITPAWFIVDNYGHFAPITRLEYLLLQRWFGLDYAVAALAPALFVAVIAMSLLWCASLMIGRRPLSLLIVAVTSTSILMMRTSLWFGSGIHVLGAAAASTLSIAGFVAFCRVRQRRALVVSLAALAAGLLIQERPLLTIGYLVLIRYMLRCGLTTPRLRLQRLRGLFKQIVDDRWLWVPYVGVVGAYLMYRLLFFASHPQPGDLGSAFVLIGSGLQRSFFPALIGRTTSATSSWYPTSAFVGVAVCILIALAVRERIRQSWRIWAFVVVTYAANMVILAVGRQAVNDAVAQSRDLQYFVDALLCVPIAIIVGLGSLPVKTVHRSTRGRRRNAISFAIVAIVIAVNTSLTWAHLIGHNPQTPARFYVGRSVSALKDQRDRYDLLRMKVPVGVIPSFIAPYNDQPSVMSLDPGIAGHIDTTAADKVVLSPQGALLHVAQRTIAQFEVTSSRVIGAGGAVISSETAGSVCVDGPPGSYVQLDLPEAAASPGLFFGLAYSLPTASLIRALSYADGNAVYNWNRTELRPGHSASRFDRLEGATIKSLWLTFEDGISNLCLKSVWIGEAAVRHPDGTCGLLNHDAREMELIDQCESGWPFVRAAG